MDHSVDLSNMLNSFGLKVARESPECSSFFGSEKACYGGNRYDNAEILLKLQHGIL